MLYNNYKNKDGIQLEETEEEVEGRVNLLEGKEKLEAFKFYDVEDNNIFFRIEEAINLFYKYVNIENYEETQYVPGSNESFAISNDIRSEEDRNNAILSFLSDEYLEKFNISTNNLFDYIEVIDLDKYIIQVESEQVYTGNIVRNYYVVAKILNRDNYNVEKKMYYMVNSNMTNDFFNIYLLTENDKNIEDFVVDNEVKDKKFNTIETKVIDDMDMAIKYFSDFKMNAMNKTSYAFELLDDEYRKIRFSNDKSKFDRYIDIIAEEWKSITITEYMVNYYDGYKEYVCRDKFENTYIFRENGPMNYMVELDTYTIPTDKFREQYNNSNNENKVKLNIDKWVKMLNNRDYENAFNYLDETFRVNTFNNSEAEFEQYMREKYPGHYEALYGEITERNGVYGQSIVLKDITGEDTTEYHLDIVMQLGEDLEFVMSYTVE